MTVTALTGPAFGSYLADDVTWLLTDISHVTLETPTEEREEAIQSGGAHYAESLPIEYQPGEQYMQVFDDALNRQAPEVAIQVAALGAQLLDHYGSGVVLVSLARAGVPAGILVKRWIEREVVRRGQQPVIVPHYAVSIVRGIGIDTVALDYIRHRHDPDMVVFVDGWTGKGAITRELTAALADTPFRADLAVLADPAWCARFYGSREDELIPSACLNSTVSGLVSRTVVNADVLAPGAFHGAKFYEHLASVDVSQRFIDAVEAVGHIDPQPRLRELRRLAHAHRVTSDGWNETLRVAYSVDLTAADINLVKPGIGETTRVLLRRVPWKVLVRRGADRTKIAHVLMLAEQRGVPVEESTQLDRYDCVGVIHPRFTRGATGAQGTAVRPVAEVVA